MKLKRIFVLVFWLSCLYCKAQQTNADTVSVYSVDKLQQDYTLFKQLLEKAHPSLYRYTRKDSIDYYFNAGYKKIDHAMSDLEFWEILQNITAKINSGHTVIRFNQRLNHLYNTSWHMVLPFHVYIRHDRLFVKGHFGGADTAFKIGNQVLKINDVSSAYLLTQFRALISGDGYSTVYKDFKLEKSDFLIFYNLLYGDHASFTITFKTQRGIETKTIKAVKVGAIPEWRPSTGNQKQVSQPQNINKQGGSERLPEITPFLDIDSTLVLTIPNFAYKNYQDIDKALFKQIKNDNIRNLVIDLRGNPGGDLNAGVDMMKYLINDNYYFNGLNEYAVDTATFIPVVNSINKKLGYKIANIVHDPTDIHNIKVYVPNGRVFKGDIYILTDGGTFSAAVLFAVALKSQRKCTVIGQETGGGEAGTDGLKFVNIKLPITGLEIYLPLFFTYSASAKQNEGHGLIPDITPVIGAKQIYEQKTLGIDPVMQVVKQEILKNRAGK